MVMTGSNSNSALYRGDLLENSATATTVAAMKMALAMFQKTPMFETGLFRVTTNSPPNCHR